MFKDPHYIFPDDNDPRYPTGGPAASMRLAVPNPDNPPLTAGDGVIAPPQQFAPGELEAAREFRVALSVWGSGDSRTTDKANAMQEFPNWGMALQYAGAQGYDGVAESALYAQFGGQ
jgi:hypothetical protein